MDTFKVLGHELCIEHFDAFVQNLLAMLYYTKGKCKRTDPQIWFNALCSTIDFKDEDEYIEALEPSRTFVENLLTGPFGACDLDDGFRRFQHHRVANMIARNECNVRDLAIRKLQLWKDYLNEASSNEDDFNAARKFINLVWIFPNTRINIQTLSIEYANMHEIQSVIDRISRDNK